jgi:hypothetical protein
MLGQTAQRAPTSVEVARGIVGNIDIMDRRTAYDGGGIFVQFCCAEPSIHWILEYYGKLYRHCEIDPAYMCYHIRFHRSGFTGGGLVVDIEYRPCAVVYKRRQMIYMAMHKPTLWRLLRILLTKGTQGLYDELFFRKFLKTEYAAEPSKGADSWDALFRETNIACARPFAVFHGVFFGDRGRYRWPFWHCALVRRLVPNEWRSRYFD